MNRRVRPERIISGGQTGVDRAALDVALDLGIPCGGWCPRGRRAEDGPLPDRYPLQETESPGYPQRTWWNVRDAGATLLLNYGPLEGGTALTADVARRLGKPWLVVPLDGEYDIGTLRGWMAVQATGILNIAGPRESSRPGIYERAAALLRELLPRRKRTTPRRRTTHP